MQLLEFPSVAGKRWHWHLTLVKEWLRTVEGGISDRKYAKWLRTRKVFDRKFVEFCYLLLGIDHPPKQAPTLTDVGQELVEELTKSEQKQAEKQEELEAAAMRGVPRSRSALPPPPSGSTSPKEAPPPGTYDADDFKPATADDDPFLKALLERFTELNSYLTMFVFKEIGDGFLAPPEAYRRIGTNDYVGKRPSMPDFEAWVGWMEWLGGLKRVGFRHKFTQAGLDVGAYLIELPVEELIGPEEPEPEPEPKPTVAEPEEPKPSPKSEPATKRDPDDEDDDEFEGDEFEDAPDLPPSADGDFEPYWKSDENPAATPPQIAEPAEAPTTQKDAGAKTDAETPAPTAKPSTAKPSTAKPSTAKPSTAKPPTAASETKAQVPSVSAIRERPKTAAARAAAAKAVAAKAAAEAATRAAEAAATEAAAAEKASALVAKAQQASAKAAAQRAAAEAAAAEAAVAEAAAAEEAAQNAAAEAAQDVAEREVAEKKAAAEAKAAAAKAAVEETAGPFHDPSKAALRLAVSWWLERTPKAKPLSESGVAVRPHPSGKPVSLFKLLTLATLLEADGPREAAVGLFEALTVDKALEAMLVDDAPLDRVLSVAYKHGAPAHLEERLVHLLRYRRGLAQIKTSDLGGDARAVARLLREKVSGSTLGPGLIFVLRELTAAGAGPTKGLDGMAWLPSLLEG